MRISDWSSDVCSSDLADPPGYADRFLAGCRAASIPVEELDPERVMAEEPNISRAVRRAFAVPDATVQSWRLLNLLADDVRLRGGQVLLRHSVLSVRVEGGRVRSEEHTSELQSLMRISYAVFCLKKKKTY